MKGVSTVAIYLVHVALFVFVLHECWVWFAVPLGAPDVGYAHTYGLSILISYPFAHAFARVARDSEIEGPFGAVVMVIGDLLAWGVAASVHSLMP